MQTKYLFSGRFYKSRETDLRPGEEIPLCVPNNRLRLHNSYHSRFPAIDLFPGKVYSCCVININTLNTRLRRVAIRREKIGVAAFLRATESPAISRFA